MTYEVTITVVLECEERPTHTEAAKAVIDALSECILTGAIEQMILIENVS